MDMPSSSGGLPSVFVVSRPVVLSISVVVGYPGPHSAVFGRLTSPFAARASFSA